ncbi:MAG TPA: nuclear transport factor 2 family protein [bacterium]
MKRYITIIVLSMLLVVSLFAQDQATKEQDKAAVKEAALNYIEGWYSGDGARMEKALHPDLAKRGIWTDRKTSKTVITPLTAEKLVEYTKQGGDKKPKDQWNIEVTIFDMLENSASIKIVSVDFIDYAHVAKIDGEWKLLNVLWEPVKKKAKE